MTMMIENEKMEELKPSKTQKKRDAEKVKVFIKKIDKLTIKQISTLDLPEEIKEEIIKGKQIKSYSAHNRQLKYVSKIMFSLEGHQLLMDKIDFKKFK